MLHIVTPLYRFENLEEIYNSIYMDLDIRWHISMSTHREKLEYDFIKNDRRIILYELDCLDTDATPKRNIALKNIKDGYFCFLDDDTVFHENMYFKYKECVEHGFKGMLIGEQTDNDGELRLVASKPVFRRIDTGNVLAHHSCLNECEWPKDFIDGINQKDFLFWDSVYNYYGKKCAIWNQPISYYNKLSKPNDDYKKKNKSK